MASLVTRLCGLYSSAVLLLRQHDDCMGWQSILDQVQVTNNGAGTQSVGGTSSGELGTSDGFVLELFRASELMKADRLYLEDHGK